MHKVLRIEGLPDAALDAAAAFHREHLVRIRAELAQAESLALVFLDAPYDHTGWRTAAIADLAREAAPRRVNGVTGENAAAIEATLAWLAQAPGITGQLLPVQTSNARNSGI
jgi:16S rRNA G966 N2-methylase RsmD